MIDVNELKGRIIAQGYTQKEIASILKITDRGLRYRFKKGRFNNNEIEILIKVLQIKNPMDIFFTTKVAR